MLCSIPTSAKSTSNWLARLRSSKGFTSGTDDDDLDLDQFLAHSHQDADSIPPKSLLPQPETANQTEPPESPNPSQGKHLVFNLMSNVLAELFIMGGDSNALPKFHPQKCSRKQPNPRFCGPFNSPAFSCNGIDISNNNDAASNDDPHAKTESASPVSDDYSGVGSAKELRGDERVKLVENVTSGDEEEDDEEKDKGCWKLSGFSRTDVTVIDTSFARWKFEKMLFRKKNVWKARDEKGKTATVTNKKKRKFTSVDDENVCGGAVKKAKVLDGQCLSGKGNGAASEQEYHHSNKSQTTCTMTSDNFGKAKKKKQSCNLEKGSSAVILIKSIPAASRKVGASFPKSSAKSTQKQVKVYNG